MTVEVANHGDQPHELVLIPLPAGTALAELLASPDPVALPPEYVVSPRQPGKSAAFTVDLDAGRYGLVCFLTDPDDTPHHQQGMHAELTAAP